MGKELLFSYCTITLANVSIRSSKDDLPFLRIQPVCQSFAKRGILSDDWQIRATSSHARQQESPGDPHRLPSFRDTKGQDRRKALFPVSSPKKLSVYLQVYGCHLAAKFALCKWLLCKHDLVGRNSFVRNSLVRRQHPNHNVREAVLSLEKRNTCISNVHVLDFLLFCLPRRSRISI